MKPALSVLPWLLLPLLAAIALAGTAAADGDPASDVLVSQDFFTPYPPPSTASSRLLKDAIQSVKAKNDRVKVAVIATPSDMGSVSSLFGQPQNYAKFLGTELSLTYKGALLIVMPAGFGFTDGGHDVPSADAILATASLTAGADGLTLSASRVLPALEHSGELHYHDSFAPKVYAAPETVIAGRRIALRYQLWDDSGRARADLEIETEKQSVLARFHQPFRVVTQGIWYRVVWRAPQTLAHRVVLFCVRATDPFGHHSQRACTTVSIS